MAGHSDSRIDDEQRSTLLERLNRPSATIGESTVDTITIDELDLQKFLIETRTITDIPPETMELVSDAKRKLRAERARRTDRLEEEPLELTTAETLVDEVLGIDRALNALENVRGPTFSDEAQSAEVEDHKRWLGFLKSIRR